MNRDGTWDETIAETSSRPLPLTEEQFHGWMSGYAFEEMLSEPNARTPPDALAATNAGGWLAETI
jgi:hypothetical protein